MYYNNQLLTVQTMASPKQRTAPSANAPAAPVVSKLDGRPHAAAAADAADATASKTTPPAVPVADPVDYTFAPKLEVKPKLKVFAPLQPTLAVAVAPSFANALAVRLVCFALFVFGVPVAAGFLFATITTPKTLIITPLFPTPTTAGIVNHFFHADGHGGQDGHAQQRGRDGLHAAGGRQKVNEGGGLRGLVMRLRKA
jgi:hypothetical protein